MNQQDNNQRPVSYSSLLLPRASKIAVERVTNLLDEIGLSYQIQTYNDGSYETTFYITIDNYMVSSIHIAEDVTRFKDTGFFPDIIVDPLKLLALNPEVFTVELPPNYEEIMGETSKEFLGGFSNDDGDDSYVSPPLDTTKIQKLLEWEDSFTGIPLSYFGTIDTQYLKNIKVAEPYIREKIKSAEMYNRLIKS